jgi:hypothetical protein
MLRLSRTVLVSTIFYNSLSQKNAFIDKAFFYINDITLYSTAYLVKIKRLLQVKRKRYSSPSCSIRTSFVKANKCCDCRVGDDYLD